MHQFLNNESSSKYKTIPTAVSKLKQLYINFDNNSYYVVMSLFGPSMVPPVVLHMDYTYLNLLDSSEIHFNYRYKSLTAKLRRQGYRYFKLRKAFSKF